MMGCFARWTHDRRCLLLLAMLTLASGLACLACGGCITAHQGGWLEPHSTCTCVEGENCHACQHGHKVTWDSLDAPYLPDAPYRPVESGEFGPPPLDGNCAECGTGCGSTCEGGTSGGRMCSGCSGSLCRWYNPDAGIFNFCVPPGLIGPYPTPPPGRFHPVPVRPVFAPRLNFTFGTSGDGYYPPQMEPCDY